MQEETFIMLTVRILGYEYNFFDKTLKTMYIQGI